MTLTAFLILPIAWSAAAAGRTLGRWLGLPAAATPWERSLVGLGLGLGLLAYALMLAGLAGAFLPAVGFGLVAALAVFGAREHLLMAREAAETLRAAQAAPRWTLAALLLLAAFGLTAWLGVLAPPIVGGVTGGMAFTEWDSLSYHLAAPKLYLQAHRIGYVPWMPHANFAETAEMWYALGLMAHSVPLAKAFHWLCGAGICAALCALGRRHCAPSVGWGGAVLFAALPVAFWEAGTAYIDLATAFFATLALLCVVNGLRDGQAGWLRAGAVLAGLCLSAKATGLAPLLLLGLWVAFAHRRQGIPSVVRQASGWFALALIVGAPWYLKSWAMTGNPLYPYFYSIFGGHFWSAERAASYAADNAPAGKSLRDLFLLPWNLTFAPIPGVPLPSGWTKQFNEFPSPIISLSPVLLAALFVPAFLPKPAPRLVRALGVYALANVLLWFSQTQFLRFLLPTLPVLCLLTAWALREAWQSRALAGRVFGVFAAGSLAWSLWIALNLAVFQAPALSAPETYIQAGDKSAAAMAFVNTDLPPDAKIAFYGCPFGFRCDRPYLWADQSEYVPFSPDPDALLRSLRARGVTHVLVGLSFFRLDAPEHASLLALAQRSGPPLYNERGFVIFALPK